MLRTRVVLATLALLIVCGLRASADTANAPLVLVDTAIDGPAPAGTRNDGSPSDADHRPGIRVGDAVYRAPWMRSSGAQGSYSGYDKDSDLSYEANIQVVAVQRGTAAVVWNRTYGFCNHEGNEYLCRARQGANPAPAHLGQDLEALPPGAIVIASSHPAVGSFFGGRAWAFDAVELRSRLAVLGLPDGTDNDFQGQFELVSAGEFSMVGIPHLAPGRADLSLARGRRGRMQGYLGFDRSTGRYDGFIPSPRVPIDTRASETCDDAACTVTITIGESTASGSIPNGKGGYLAAVYEPHTLDRLEPPRTFVTGGCPSGSNECAAAAIAMESTLDAWSRGTDLLVVVTSVETPKQQPEPRTVAPDIYQVDWIRLGKTIAALGGTRHVFNTAAGLTNRTYSLVGRSGAGEGNAFEALQSPGGGSARIRGVLVPDSRSLYRLRNASASDGPFDRLQEIVLRAPAAHGAWPDLSGGPDDTPGHRAAIAYISSQCDSLAPDARSAYLLQSLGVRAEPDVPEGSSAVEAQEQVDRVKRPDSASFTQADFDWAHDELIAELTWVEKTRLYLHNLAAPIVQTGTDSWPTAKTLADQLKTQLSEIDEKAEIAFDAFGLVEGLLEIGSAFTFPTHAGEILKQFIEVLAGSVELAKVGYEAKYANPADSITITADELAGRLKSESDRAADTFVRFGDAIVSDYTKLAEVGSHAACDPCAPGYEGFAYSEELYTKAKTVATRALDRAVYEHLVPLAFGVRDTGFASIPDPKYNYTCDVEIYTPFDGAPADGWGRDGSGHFGASALLLDELDPGLHTFDPDHADLPHTRSRTFLLLHKHDASYGWPDQEILDRMFGPVSEDEWNFQGDEGGLAISPQDLMRRAWNQGGATRYVPPGDSPCSWIYQNANGVVYEPGPR